MKLAHGIACIWLLSAPSIMAQTLFKLTEDLRHVDQSYELLNLHECVVSLDTVKMTRMPVNVRYTTTTAINFASEDLQAIYQDLDALVLEPLHFESLPVDQRGFTTISAVSKDGREFVLFATDNSGYKFKKHPSYKRIIRLIKDICAHPAGR